MDNWDYFQENLSVAYESTGELNKQAEIYAESWEASSNRVQAALEGIYDSLIDEEFFIKLNDLITILLGGVEQLIDGFGGLGGIVSMVLALFTTTFGDKITKVFGDTIRNIKYSTAQGKKSLMGLKEEAYSEITAAYKDEAQGTVGSDIIATYTQMSESQKQLNDLAAQMTEEQARYYGELLKQQRARADELIQLADTIKLQEELISLEEKESAEKGFDSNTTTKIKNLQYETDSYRSMATQMQQMSGNDFSKEPIDKQVDSLLDSYEKRYKIEFSSDNEQIPGLREAIAGRIKELQGKGSSDKAILKTISTELQDLSDKRDGELLEQIRKFKPKRSSKDIQQAIKKLTKEKKSLDSQNQSRLEEIDYEIQDLENEQKNTETLEKQSQIAEKLLQRYQELSNSVLNFNEASNAASKSQDSLEKQMKEVETATFQEGEALAFTTEAITALGMSLSSLKNIFDIVNNDDLTWYEKLFQGVSNLIPLYITLNNVINAENATKIKNLLISKGVISATTATTAATTAATAATVGSNAALAGTGVAAAGAAKGLGVLKAGWVALKGAAIALLNPWVAIPLAIVAGLAAVIGIYDHFTETAEEACERLKEENLELTDSLNQATQAANELKSSFDSYDKVSNALDDCIQGTVEWGNALRENNNLVLDLLEKYPELANMVNDKGEKAVESENGVLSIADWAMEYLQEKNQSKIDANKAALYQNEQNQREAELNVLKESNQANFDAYVMGTSFTRKESEKVFENLDQFKDLSPQGVASIIKEILGDEHLWSDSEYDNLVTRLENQPSFINDFLTKYKEDSENNKALNKSEDIVTVGAFLSNNEIVRNSAFQNQLIEGSATSYDKIYNEKLAEINNKKASKIEEEYEEFLGEGIDLKEKDGKYFYTDENGQEHSFSLETMKNTLAADQANAVIEENIPGLEEFYTNLVKEGYGSFIEVLNSGNVENISKEDYEKYSQEITGEKLKNLGYNPDIYGDYNDLNWSEQADTIFEDIKNRFDTFSKDFGIDVGELSSKVNSNEAIAIESMLEDTFEKKGKKATQSLADIYNQAGSEAGELSTILNNIDWPSGGGVEQLNAAIEEQGLDIDTTSYAWQSYIDEMSKTILSTDNLINSVEELRDKMTTIQELVGDIKLGDIISDEDYKQLLAYNEGIADFFVMGASGYQFIGDAEELKQVLKISKDNIGEYQKQFEEARNLGKELSTTDWITLSSGSDISKAEEMYAQEKYSNFLGDIGSSKDAFEKDLATVKKGDTESEEYQKAINKVREYYKTVANYQQKYEEGLFNDSVLSSMAATQAEDLDDLNELLQDNIVTIEDYNKQKLRMIQIEHEASDIDLDTWEEYAEYLEENNDLLKGNSEQAKIVASAILRLNKGLDDIQENYSDWNKAILNASENSREYVTAITGMRNAVADVLNVSNDYVSNDFIVEHLNDIKLAAEGDIAAIERLRVAFVENIAGEEVFSEIKDEFLDFQNFLLTNPLELGAKLDNHSFIDACNQMIASGKMTALQVQEAFKSLGFDVELNSVTVPVPEVKRVRGKRKEGIDPRAANDPDFFEWDTETTYRDVVVTGVKFITSTGSTGGNIDYTNTKAGGAAIKESSDKPSKMDRTKRSDVVDRYKEISDSIDDLTDALEDANKQADRLYGANRLQKMKQQNKLIQDEIGLLKRKKSEALGYLASDRGALNAAASAAGASFTYDASGNITNYTQEMNRLYDQLSAAEAAFNSMGSKDAQESYQEKTLDPLQKKIDDLKDYLSQYEETRELIEDLDNEIDDKFYEWQDNNYEQLTYALELDIEINDLQLEKVEYYLNKMADDFYSMAESAALIASKMPITESSLKSQEEFYNGITQAYANGEISQSAYIEGLKETYSGMLNQLSTLNDLDKEMMAYYGETLSAANDEIDKHVSKIEHLNSILDHYKNILGILGETTNYKALGGILEGQAKVIKNELDVAVATYNMYKNEVDMWQEKMNSAVKNSEAWEVYKTNWEAALEASNQAQEEMLAKTEEWAEAMKAIVENNLSDYAQSLENTLTGGTSFDQMTTSLERAASLQEEYLTATNQLYETTKLMRTAQINLDKTSNITAKNKIKAFIEETAQLQEQGKLSNYELEIQQAKYNLLVAEIALKDAQDAKNIVRLQRDSEGNFGYIYTADQDKVAQAQQQFEDAQNNLYNIGLRGANDYTQKYQQTLAQMYDTLTQLQEQWLNGEFESEQEYQNAVLEAKQYYYNLLEQYSELYQISLTTHSEVARDAWGADFEQMTMNTDQWMLATDDYLSQVEQEFRNWGDVVEEVKNYVGEDLTESQNKVQDVIDTSQELTDQALNEVIPAINSELDAVGDLTAAFAAQRGELKNLMGYYENLLGVISSTITQHKNLTSAAQEAQKAIQAAQVAGNQYHSNTGNVGNGGNGKEKGDTDSPYTPPTTPKYRWFRVDHDESNTHGIQNQQTGTFFSDAQLIQKGYVIGATYGTHNNGNGIGIEILSLKRIKDKTYMSLSNIDKFDTGGYTGVWGQSGKLAMLHEKELVLNKEDTSNLLFTVEMVRDIIRSIDLNALSSQYGGLRSPGYSSGSTGILEQSVVIEANFPSVTERGEIEEAFKNLINTASQYANRK